VTIYMNFRQMTVGGGVKDPTFLERDRFLASSGELSVRGRAARLPVCPKLGPKVLSASAALPFSFLDVSAVRGVPTCADNSGSVLRIGKSAASAPNIAVSGFVSARALNNPVNARLDRKLERTLAMLMRLKDLRRTSRRRNASHGKRPRVI
jgi:hypothetical protein